ncbi:MAG: tetratricopeptide repeat protein [Terriglobales bacterium]
MHVPQRIAKFPGLILCFTAVTVYFALVSVQYLAYHLSKKIDLKSLKLAIRLEPGNAEYQYKLADAFSRKSSLPEALNAFHQATKLNPHVAKYWIRLASANRSLGLVQAERDAVQKAIAADPKNPEIAWVAGNLYKFDGDTHSAFAALRTAFEGDPSLSGQVIELCWQMRPDLDTLLQVIPATAPAYSEFLEFLISKKETASAAKVWVQMVGLGQPLQQNAVFDYIRYLVGQQEPEAARLVWHQAGPLGGLDKYQPSPANLIVNGDFSLDILDGGFGWAYARRPGVALQLDPTAPHLGSRSLLISYDSRGLDDSGILQLIPVEPDSAYHFSAYFKTRDLEGAGGPRFLLRDFYTGESYFESDDLKDSSVWKPVSGDLKTGPQTRLLVLQIERVPSGAAIRGNLWIDGLGLAPVAIPASDP